jgi:hypothetical protein
MHNTQICYAEPDSTKLNGPVSETGGSGIFMNSDNSSEMMTVDPDN